MGLQGIKTEPHHWNQSLKWCRAALALKVSGLALLGIINLAAIGYGSYRLYNFVPTQYKTALAFTPIIGGMLCAVLIHKNGAKDAASGLGPTGINERNLVVYSNPMTPITAFASYLLLGPFVYFYDNVDRTNYGHRGVTSAIAEDLKNRNFSDLTYTHLRHYRNVMKYGFIKKDATLPDFSVNFDSKKGDTITIKNDNQEINVKQWIKKANQSIRRLHKQLQSHKKLFGSDNPVLLGEIEKLNKLWKDKFNTTCYEYSGETQLSLSWYDENLVWSTQQDLNKIWSMQQKSQA